MYDFLFQEEWWMETIIAAAITGAVTLVAAYLMYATKVEKKLEKIEDSNSRMEGQTKLLSGEHRDLFKEHSDIKSEIQKVIANQEKEKAVREAYGKVIPEGDTFKHMADAIYMHSVQLQQEVTILNDKIAQLNKENHDQKLQIISLQDKIQKLKQQKVSKEQQNKKEPKSDYEDVINFMDISHDNLDDEEWER